MIEAKTVLELFEGHPERWTRHAYAMTETGNITNPKSPNAISWCLMGACTLIGVSFTPLYDLLPDGITNFNDNPNTTFDEVLDLVRKAGI